MNTHLYKYVCIPNPETKRQYRRMSCNVLQCVAVCRRVLQWVAVGCNWLNQLHHPAYQIAQFKQINRPIDISNSYTVCILRVAACCSVLQCVAACCSVLQCVAVCCSVLQCVAVCCCGLQCVAVGCSVLQCVTVWCNMVQGVAGCCNMLQCVAVCCSVLQCVAVCCTVIYPFRILFT